MGSGSEPSGCAASYYGSSAAGIDSGCDTYSPGCCSCTADDDHAANEHHWTANAHHYEGGWTGRICDAADSGSGHEFSDHAHNRKSDASRDAEQSGRWYDMCASRRNDSAGCVYSRQLDNRQLDDEFDKQYKLQQSGNTESEFIRKCAGLDAVSQSDQPNCCANAAIRNKSNEHCLPSGNDAERKRANSIDAPTTDAVENRNR